MGGKTEEVKNMEIPNFGYLKNIIRAFLFFAVNVERGICMKRLKELVVLFTALTLVGCNGGHEKK